MNYDPVRNCYVDPENGAIIPISEGDDLQGVELSEVEMNSFPTDSGYESMNHAASDEDPDADRRYAESLQREYICSNNSQAVEGPNKNTTRFTSVFKLPTVTRGPAPMLPILPQWLDNAPAAPEQGNRNGGWKAKTPKETHSEVHKQIFNMARAGLAKKSANELIPEHPPELDPTHTNDPTAAALNGEDENAEDWGLARALQFAEMEIEQEMYQEAGGDFVDKEIRGSSCVRQLKTVSTLICVLQVIFLILMIRDDGYAPKDENTMIGPYATTMVRWGAKSAALILYRNEWWRLVSPIMLHAGIIHLISNVIIQLRVGAYLNLVYGTPKWLAIYILSGIFGNMVSCIFIPESISVGSSGALLGILSSWMVWLIFRWNKIPASNRGQRNCQFVVVTASVITTLSMSFSKYVDWGAHFGGAIQGILLGIVLLSYELDNPVNKQRIRVAALIASVTLFAVALYYMLDVIHPSKGIFPLLDANDDWNQYPHHGPQQPS